MSHCFLISFIFFKYLLFDCVVLLDGKNDSSFVSQFSLEEQNQIIQRHNDLRGALALGLFNLPQSSNMQEMIYDSSLEEYAKNHTNKCNFELSNIEEYGENIFKTNSSEGPFFSLLIGLNVWWDQIKHVNSNIFTNNENSLNFAQMAWATTYKVGCDVNDCGKYKLSMCYYYPRGNIDNNDIYKAGPYCLCSLINKLEGTNVTLTPIKENNQTSPENAISIGGIGDGLINTVQNGINDAGSFIKNTSSNLISHAENTANGLLGGATGLINNVGQVVGNIPNLINGTLFLNSNKTDMMVNNLTATLNGLQNGTQSNLTNVISLLNNGMTNGRVVLPTFNGTVNLLNTSSNIVNHLNNITENGLNNLTILTNPLLNQTIGNISGTLIQLTNGTGSLVTTTENSINITNTNNLNVSSILTTTITEDLLNKTTNILLSSTTPKIGNETVILGSSSISPTMNVSSTTELISINVTTTNETTTLSPKETTTCEWGIICNNNVQVTNQILANIITNSSNINNSSSIPDNGNCKDLQDNCDLMILFCSFIMYQPFMFKTCQKTCKQC
ncbi:CAP domain-containing protein [Strongyloides ratti]|uniref:CAP domain-containing protein n=1 Tax=Strongyloides ratti TaxID=34506 RepID=A0A090LM74_STRRB|nr:CAP domain-containing protein [Strongyloides ratti]CEF70826.2 CAP domain-containing protein [Strongyloides ratti]